MTAPRPLFHTPSMTPVTLKNASETRSIVVSELAKRTDKALVPIERLCLAGGTITCDGDNPGIRIYAKAGLMTPVDEAGRRWLRALRGEAEVEAPKVEAPALAPKVEAPAPAPKKSHKAKAPAAKAETKASDVLADVSRGSLFSER